MDLSKKNSNPNSNSYLGSVNLTPTGFQRRAGFWKEFEEANENEGHPQSPLTIISAASKKKKKKKTILAERNADDPPLQYSSNTHLETTPQEKPVMAFDSVEAHPQEIHPFSLMIHSISNSSCSVPYDPVSNYTSPRPAFLHYKPERLKEILLRMRDEEGSSVDSGTLQDQKESIVEDLLSWSSTSPKLCSGDKDILEDAVDEGDPEIDYCQEEEVEQRAPWCFRMVWKLLLLFGVFLFSHQYLFPMSSSFRPFQENIPTTGNSLYQNFLLKTHMGLSDVCFDIGEGMCGIKIPDNYLVVSDDYVMMGRLADSEKNDFLMSDEVDRVLDSSEKESIDGIEFVDDRNGDLVDRGIVQNGDKIVVEERREKPLSSHLFYEQEENSQREGSDKEEILETETLEYLSISPIKVESVQTLDDQFVDDESHMYQNASLENNSSEEAQVEENLELSEPLIASQFQSVSSSLQDDQAAQKSEIPGIYETSLGWELGLEFGSKDVQFLLLLLSLLAVLGLVSLLFKYFARAHQEACRVSSTVLLPADKSIDERSTGKDVNPLPSGQFINEHTEPLLVSPPSSMLLPCSWSADETRTLPAVSVMEELRAEGKDSYVRLMSSTYSSHEMKGFYATRPPSVELLGEFSIDDGVASKVASGQTLNGKRYEELEFSKSQGRRVPEDSQISQSESSRTVKIKSHSPPSKVHPYYTSQSTSHGSYIAQKKPQKKEDTIAKIEAKEVVATPLRRSSRLRNRVTSTLHPS